MRRPADVSPGNADADARRACAFEVRTPAGAVQIPRHWSAGRTSTTSSQRSRPRSRSACRRTRSKTGIAALAGVPGRFEVVSAPATTSTVVVDYAHTDDALKNLLETVRGARARPRHHGVRLRRRSRSHEAPADGRGRRPHERRRHRDLGQSALRGSRRDHRRGDAGHAAAERSHDRVGDERRVSRGPEALADGRSARGDRSARWICAETGDLVVARGQGTREGAGDRRAHRSGSTTWRWRARHSCGAARGCRWDDVAGDRAHRSC